MTTHLIEYDDMAYLGFNTGYLKKLPEYIEAFKITLGLVSEADYGRYNEPAMDQVITLAEQGSSLWTASATQIRSIHQDTRQTLAEVIQVLDSHSLDGRLPQLIQALMRQKTAFERQKVACDGIIECAQQTTPRFMDFMKLRMYEHAKRKGLLVTSSNNAPEMLISALRDESSLASARSKLEWHRRAYNTAILSAGNMGAYCSRLSCLLSATVEDIQAIEADLSPRQLAVSCQSAASSAREALRLIDYTHDLILRFRF
ncbi:hypothetical protein [Pseudomonas sp. NFR16]|uniref:hypothetical protein n=1 Tax=Pseudomonas sp. NFR16 TaxID=1566248 RepID=UPI0008B6D1E7|nr:hypothetical protein [Pseudomonas sp. NFR16]SEJ29968.1 hypothetical protein SAMN03159495_2776 [Pseudomonas sp. NFR16]